jgi:two-component system response regulator TctD
MSTPQCILYTDTDAQTGATMRGLLEHTGYRVETAEAVDEAVALARQMPFDLYVLDHHLTDGDGVAVCEHIRAFDSKTPLIVYSTTPLPMN